MPVRSRSTQLVWAMATACATICVLLAGGCSEEDAPPVTHDPLLGCWESLFYVQGSDTTFPGEIGQLWIFSADRTLCALDEYPSGSYGPDIHVRYWRGEGSVTLLFAGEVPWYYACVFSARNDTLTLYSNDERLPAEQWMVLGRRVVVPENDYCDFVPD